MESYYEWLQPDRVLLCRYRGDMRGSAMADAQNELGERYTDNHVGMIHLVFDFSGITHFETDLRRVRDALYRGKRDNIAWVVAITPNPVIRFVFSVAVHLAIQGANLRFEPNVAAGMAFLAKQDPSVSVQIES